MRLLAMLLALTLRGHPGDAVAFPQMTTPDGAPLADAKFTQQVEGDRLVTRLRYDFPDGRVIEERSVLRLHPLLQESWSWKERGPEGPIRSYAVDFKTGDAEALRDGKTSHEHLDDLEPGKTFTGIAFIEVIASLRPELAKGQSARLRAVAFTPGPRTAPVDVIHDGETTLQMAGRAVKADGFTIHPAIPGVVKLFVKAPDQHIWVVEGEPTAFLRFEGPEAEPSDPIIRVDLIPGRPASTDRALARNTSSPPSGRAGTSHRRRTAPSAKAAPASGK